MGKDPGYAVAKGKEPPMWARGEDEAGVVQLWEVPAVTKRNNK